MPTTSPHATGTPAASAAAPRASGAIDRCFRSQCHPRPGEGQATGGGGQRRGDAERIEASDTKTGQEERRTRHDWHGETHAIAAPVPASTTPVAADRRMSPPVPSPRLCPRRPTNMPPRNRPPSSVATSVVTPVCRSTRVAPQKTIGETTAMTRNEERPRQPEPHRQAGSIAGPRRRARRGPARRSRATMTSSPRAGMRPRPHGRPLPDALARTTGHRTPRPWPTRSRARPAPGEPPAGTTEQGVGVSQQRPGA